MKNTGSKKISERYVSALFAVVLKDGAVAEVEKDLRDISALIKENTDFRAFLTNPLLTREAQSTIAGNLLTQFGANPATVKFVTLLARHKRLTGLQEMIDMFLEKAATERGELAAELVTAAPVTEKEAMSVADSLSKAYGRKVMLTVRVDPALLGGTIINIGSVQLDSSLAGKLNRLEHVLKAA